HNIIADICDSIEFLLTNRMILTNQNKTVRPTFAENGYSDIYNSKYREIKIAAKKNIEHIQDD
ncbi:MAG TPA: hypothetical protein PK147_07490, partial [Saprospiraceae bacterium]|nr:hypothetical protein [Saprospiraceae bacterium]